MSRRVLIVDATATNRIALKAALAAARYDVRAVATATEALTIVEEEQPDFIIADANLPDMPGSELCRYIVERFGTASPPLLLLSDETSPGFRLSALRAGAFTLMERPLDRPWLLTNLRALLRAHESRAELRRRNVTASRLGFAEDPAEFAVPARIAVVSADRGRSAAFARSLRDHFRDHVEQMTPIQALGAADTDAAPEAFVLCHDDDPEESLALLAELRARSATRRAAILVEYDHTQRDKGARALDQGASDILPVAASPAERALRLVRQLHYKRDADSLRRTVDAGLQLAAYDPLTSLYNRRYAMRHLSDLAMRPHADGRGYAVMIVDVDLFKAVNDEHGHAVGDRVLQQVAARLRENMRDVDLVARIGGEEFLIALPDSSIDEALVAAERLRGSIAERSVDLPGGVAALPITISVGVCCSADTCASFESIMATADQALYAAKAAGRNRVRAMQADAEPEPQAKSRHETIAPPLRQIDGPGFTGGPPPSFRMN